MGRTGVAEVVARLLDALRKRFLSLTNPDAWVVILLVWLVSTFGVADLGSEVGGFLLDKIADASKVGKLRVGINVHLNNTVADCGLDLLLRRARATMEDEEERLGIWLLDFLGRVYLVLAK